MQILIRSEHFDPWLEVINRQAGAGAARGSYGATSVFVGTMRDFNENEAVGQMTLEHYPEMTEHHLMKICESANKKWDLLDVLVVHRVGTINPGDPIVLVAVWSSHRKEAFEASRYIMEDLKSKAPFWKKEKLTHGHRWVEKNTAG